MSNDWETLDTEDLIRRREEQTTSANVGAYPVPLGAPSKAPTRALPGYEYVDAGGDAALKKTLDYLFGR